MRLNDLKTPRVLPAHYITLSLPLSLSPTPIITLQTSVLPSHYWATKANPLIHDQSREPCQTLWRPIKEPSCSSSSWPVPALCSQALPSMSPEQKPSSQRKQSRHNLVKIAILSPPTFFQACPLPTSTSNSPSKFQHRSIDYSQISDLTEKSSPQLTSTWLGNTCVFTWWLHHCFPFCCHSSPPPPPQNCQGRATVPRDHCTLPWH